MTLLASAAACSHARLRAAAVAPVGDGGGGRVVTGTAACDDGLHSVLPYRAQVTVAHKELGWVLFEPLPPEGAEPHVHDLRLPAGRVGAQCALPIEPASLTSGSLFVAFVISATVAHV